MVVVKNAVIAIVLALSALRSNVRLLQGVLSSLVVSVDVINYRQGFPYAVARMTYIKSSLPSLIVNVSIRAGALDD